MIELLIAIILGFVCPADTKTVQNSPETAVYSTNDTGGDNGQVPPPPFQ